MQQNTVNARVYEIRPHKSKAGKDGFKQDVEILNEGAPGHSYTHYFNDEKYAYPVGDCTAKAKFYRGTYQNKEGKNVYIHEAAFSEFKLA